MIHDFEKFNDLPNRTISELKMTLIGIPLNDLNWDFHFEGHIQKIKIMKSEEIQDLFIREQITKAIHLIRRQKVMIDSELAEMYGVETKRLNEQAKRNIDRFPSDFMFQLTEEEWNNFKQSRNEDDSLRSQFATLENQALQSNNDHLDLGRGRHRKYMPYVFTEQGVAMLSSVLNSPTAIQVNISIMRVFVKMRQWAANYEDLIDKINELSENQGVHNAHIRNIYQIIEELVRPSIIERKSIGFKID